VRKGSSLDWFRFWLQDYQGSDPAMTEQDTRWRELKKMQRPTEKAKQQMETFGLTCT